MVMSRGSSGIAVNNDYVAVAAAAVGPVFSCFVRTTVLASCTISGVSGQKGIRISSVLIICTAAVRVLVFVVRFGVVADSFWAVCTQQLSFSFIFFSGAPDAPV